MIISGIEPVDEMMGGLEHGQLYLVHGEASGKSLFGIKFLIEGLKRGENGALVIRYSPEDAVGHFARLGYDCLEDVYSGRLVILEYSDDIIKKIGKLPELTPVLRELEWLLGETRPERLIFDPVTSVLAGAEGNLDTRARDFAEWARSFGATVVLIADDSNHEITKSFGRLVAESFRFDVREAGDRAARFIAFEKSSTVPDQAIEVDPSRGVFLLGRAYRAESPDVHQASPYPPSVAELESVKEQLRSTSDQIHKGEGDPLADINLIAETSGQTDRTPQAPDAGQLVSDAEGGGPQIQKLTPVDEGESRSERTSVEPGHTESLLVEDLELSFEEPLASYTPSEQFAEVQHDALSDLLDDLTSTASPLDLDLPELESAYDRVGRSSSERPSSAAVERPAIRLREAQPSVNDNIGEGIVRGRDADVVEAPRPRHGRASDFKIDSAMAARAVEHLLVTPEADTESELLPSHRAPVRGARQALQPDPSGAEVRAKDFNVLIIEDDTETCNLVTQTLDDYTLQVVHDGVSGLARLISFKPDLVVLDFDLPIIDGFKVLALIRSALNVPIVIVSGSRMRAIDRVMASELGADYYLTKPFSAKELKNKARQLIARHRGITSWIMNPASTSLPQRAARSVEPRAASIESEGELFTPYEEFAGEVEKRVRAAIDDGAPFSIVGCRLPQMSANAGSLALRLYDIVRELMRETDLTSANGLNDLVVLLPDANTSGARAFASRLEERVIKELNQKPALWMRSFPDLEESTEASAAGINQGHGGTLNRRSSDKAIYKQNQRERRRSDESAGKPDPSESCIDFLERL